MRWGGFQKWVVRIRSGRAVRAAMAVMLMPEVLEQRRASGAARSSRAKLLTGKPPFVTLGRFRLDRFLAGGGA